jgi:diketogulonate reductase-like aldo/keto reductase
MVLLQKEETIKKLIRKTYTFFDTAEIYAIGANEQLVAGALKKVFAIMLLLLQNSYFKKIGRQCYRTLDEIKRSIKFFTILYYQHKSKQDIRLKILRTVWVNLSKKVKYWVGSITSYCQ